jgi:hypothetical protein
MRIPDTDPVSFPVSLFIDRTGKGSQNGVLTGTRAGMQLNTVAKRVHGLASVVRVKGQDMFGLLSKVSIVSEKLCVFSVPVGQGQIVSMF